MSYIKTLVFLILLGIPVLTGCSVNTQEQKRPDLVLPESPEVKMRPVKWGINDSKICLSPEQYSNLSLNTDDIKNFIIFQNKVIKIYKEYYINNNSSVSKGGKND